MSVSRPIDVIVSGVLCLDLLPRMEHVPLTALSSPGKLFEVGSLSISTGGAVSNTGLALHKLGVNVQLMAPVGDDLIGRATIEFLNSRDSRLTEALTVEKGQSGSYTIVLSPEQADRLFLHCAGVNANFTAKSVRYELLQQAKIFHFGYPPTLPRMYENGGDELIALMSQAKETGVVTSLDMTFPDAHSASGRADWEAILIKTLPYTDIFIPSLEEALYMLRRRAYAQWHGDLHRHVTRSYVSALADELIEMGVAVAGLKLGAYGIVIKTASMDRLSSLTPVALDHHKWADEVVYHPAYVVNVAGTTGAGDAAYAGFLTAMLRGCSPTEAARWACAVGACNVEAVDATSGVQSWNDTLRRIESGWELSDNRLE